MANGEATIVIKKVVKGGGGHHGGAWKVAYADFVTAMMAFFLLLWLLNVTTDEQRHGVADYFAPSAASKSTSGSGGIMGGMSMSTEGARVGQSSPPSVVMEMVPPRQRKPAEEDEDQKEGEAGSEEAKQLEDEELMRQMAEREQEVFEEAEEALRQAMDDSPGLSDMAKNLIIDNTPEGLRIQLVDQENASMFPSGGSTMQENLKKILEKVADIIHRMPNQIAITGHTDSVPFRGRNDYSNWELSAERANASRRTLVGFGVPVSRIALVSGKADTEPLVPEDPTLPTNRRISIVLLREAALMPSAPPAPPDN